MSLINDALKKAQQQRAQDGSAAPPAARTDQPAAPSGPTPAPQPASRYAAVPPITRYIPPPAERPKRAAPKKNAYGTGATAAVVAACIAVTLYLLLTDSTPEEAADIAAPPESTPGQVQPAPFAAPTLAITTTPHADPQVANTPEEPAPPSNITTPAPSVISTPALAKSEAPSTPLPPPRAIVPPAPTPVTPPVAQNEAKAQPATAPSTQATTAPVAVATTAAAPAANSAQLPSLYTPRPPTTINPAARAQNFIDRLRVSGVRFTSTGSKVILNDRLFQETEVVDSTLGLRLVKIEQGALTFVDAQGRTYLKLFQ